MRWRMRAGCTLQFDVVDLEAVAQAKATAKRGDVLSRFVLAMGSFCHRPATAPQDVENVPLLRRDGVLLPPPDGAMWRAWLRKTSCVCVHNRCVGVCEQRRLRMEGKTVFCARN